MATLEGADKNFSDSLNKLFNDTGGKVGLESGYRSPEEQQKLRNAAEKAHPGDADNWAAKPGHSNHEKGFAADISGYKNVTDEQLAKYGLYRPMSWEPWHVEPTGYKGSDQAYTTPKSGNPGLDTAMQAMTQLFSNVGQQTSDVGVQGSNVGEQTSAVGTDAMDVAGSMAQVAQTEASTAATGEAQGASSGGGDIESLLNSIKTQESGGNYNARNKDSGAFGAYQIIPANWPSWSKEAGLGANAAQTPENQDKVARFKLGQYMTQFGSADKAAKAWYSGPGNVDKNVSGGGSYPTSDNYSKQVTSRMNKYGTTR